MDNGNVWMKNSLPSEEKGREMSFPHSELHRRNALQVVLYCCASPLAQQLISAEGGTFRTHGASPLSSGYGCEHSVWAWLMGTNPKESLLEISYLLS